MTRRESLRASAAKRLVSWPRAPFCSFACEPTIEGRQLSQPSQSSQSSQPSQSSQSSKPSQSSQPSQPSARCTRGSLMLVGHNSAAILLCFCASLANVYQCRGPRRRSRARDDPPSSPRIVAQKLGPFNCGLIRFIARKPRFGASLLRVQGRVLKLSSTRKRLINRTLMLSDNFIIGNESARCLPMLHAFRANWPI